MAGDVRSRRAAGAVAGASGETVAAQAVGGESSLREIGSSSFVIPLGRWFREKWEISKWPSALEKGCRGVI